MLMCIEEVYVHEGTYGIEIRNYLRHHNHSPCLISFRRMIEKSQTSIPWTLRLFRLATNNIG